jgi:hypothetical protein
VAKPSRAVIAVRAVVRRAVTTFRCDIVGW